MSKDSVGIFERIVESEVFKFLGLSCVFVTCVLLATYNPLQVLSLLPIVLVIFPHSILTAQSTNHDNNFGHIHRCELSQL